MKTTHSVNVFIVGLFILIIPFNLRLPLHNYSNNLITEKYELLMQNNTHLHTLATTASTVRISGFVTNTSGDPIPQVIIDVYGDANERLDILPTNSKGYYEFSLPRNQIYRMILTSSIESGNYQLFNYVPVTRDVIPGDSADIQTDIVLQASGNLILQAYDENGNLLRNASFKEISGNYVTATDLEDIPLIYWCDAIRDVYTNEHGGNLEFGIPACAIPTQNPQRLHILWDVPDFGKVIVNADNEGGGYSVADQGGSLVLNLNYEMAKSELATLSRDHDIYVNLGYTFDSSINDGIQSSKTHLLNAEQFLKQSPVAMAMAVAELNQSLSDSLWTQEELQLQKSQPDIKLNRMGSVRLQVLDSDGQPVPGVSVKFQQVTHNFLFGAQPMGDGPHRYLPNVSELLDEAGVNYAHISADWGEIEKNPGQFDWYWMDQDQNALALLDQGYKLKGGTAFWFTRNDPTDFHDTSKYLYEMNFLELQSNVYEHMRTLASQYRGKIDLWEFNEQNIPQSNMLNLTWDQKIELVRSAIDGMKAGNPDAKAIFTSIALPYDYNVMKLESTAIQAGAIPFHDYLNLLISRNIIFDAIGLEFYYAGIDSGGNARPGLSMASQSRVMDQYAIFEKPIYITELSAPSAQFPESNWWHHPWDETTQAEYLDKFYKIAFSKPLVQEIAWSYGIIDGESFIQSGGLLDPTGKPKLAYTALKNLIDSWTSSGVETTNENGEILISGFAGDYQLQVDDGTNNSTFTTKIIEQENTILTLTLPASTPTITSIPIRTPTDKATILKTNKFTQHWILAIGLIIPVILFVILLIRRFLKKH